MSRRNALKVGAGLAATGMLGETNAQSVEPALPIVYELLGVKRVINAAGTFTNLGGSGMPPDVVSAWLGGSKSFGKLAHTLLQLR